MQIIDELKKEAQMIYLPKDGLNADAKKMLIIVHSLKLTGSGYMANFRQEHTAS